MSVPKILNMSLGWHVDHCIVGHKCPGLVRSSNGIVVVVELGLLVLAKVA